MSGIGGHILHLYEDPTLRFIDLLNITRGIQLGKINLYEKFDGVNMVLKFKENGDLGFCRNNQQLASPLSLRDMIYYIKHENVGEALSELNPIFDHLRKEMNNYPFLKGKYINIELIHPKIENLIQYKEPFIVLHNAFKYEDNKIQFISIKETEELFKPLLLNKLIKIIGPNQITLDKFNGKLNLDTDIMQFISNHKVNFTDSVYKHMEDNLESFIRATYPKLTNELLIKSLINRWLYDKKKDNLIDKRFGQYTEAIRLFEQMSLKETLKKLRYPLEIMIGKTAEVLLAHTSGNFGMGIKNLNSILKKSISQLKQDPVLNEKVRFDILKFTQLYNYRNIQYEGVVFTYNNKQYKLTGVYAPINQITGLFKFKR